MNDEHGFTAWSPGDDLDNTYYARCRCLAEVQARDVDTLGALMQDHLDQMTWEREQMEAEEQH